MRNWATEEERVKCPLCRAVVSHRVGAEWTFLTRSLCNSGTIRLIQDIRCRSKYFVGRGSIRAREIEWGQYRFSASIQVQRVTYIHIGHFGPVTGM